MTEPDLGDVRRYWKADGTSVMDEYFASRLKEVYFQTWGSQDMKHNKWIYRDTRGELTQVFLEHLPGPIKLVLLLEEDLD